VFVLDHMYMSLFSTLGWILRLGVTMALLASIHPALILLAVFAVPTVLTSTWRPEVERSAQERGAQTNRLARHLFTIATTAPPGKEVRVTGIGERLITDRRAAWDRWYGPVAAARWGSAWWHALAWSIFGLAYVGSVVFVSSVLKAPASAVLLVLAAGARLSAYIGATVGEIGFLRGFWMDGSRRLAWLEDYAASVAASGDLPVPSVLQRGVRLDHVSFAYPGTSRIVLDDVSMTLPAGAVVAIVGENGAGKTTLVKLLAKMYEPSSGSIFVDDTPLKRLPAGEWRARLAGAFQDFFRFEFRAGHTVGLGDLPDWTTSLPCSRLSTAPARLTSSPVSRQDSTRSSVQRGRPESSYRSASGRSSRWRAASCAINPCFSSSTNRPPRWIRRPNTRCLSATPRRHAARTRVTAAGSRSLSHTVSRRSAWPT
jgi:ATP-binding cassette, subfamily B, bacterial